MFLRLFLIAVTLACTAAQLSTNVPNRCPQPTATNPVTPSFLYGHPDDCSYYIICSNGTPYIQKCSPGTVWSDSIQNCVGFNNHQDTCTRDNAQRECAKLQGGPLLIPHPKECQRYYNCSNTALPGQFSFLRQYEDECPYPQVFDVNEKKCKSFKEGYCGLGRVAAKDACDYVKNLCGSGHCEGCSSRLPSCVGLADGIHEHKGRLWTPLYSICDTERLVNIKRCDSNVHPTLWKVIFSPVKQKCVTLWEVPRQFGGLAPLCDDKPAGQYRTSERVDVYYTCPSAEVSYCEAGFGFNEISGRCEKLI